MRVAVIVRSLKIGGMERVAVTLCEAFADSGYESHLIYFKDKNRAFSPKKEVYLHHFNLDKTLKLTLIGFIFAIFSKLLSAIFRGSFFIYNGILLAPIFKYKFKKLEKEYGKFDLIIIRGLGTIELIWPYKDERIVQMVESVFIRDTTYLDKFFVKAVFSQRNLAGVSSGVSEKVLEVLKKTEVKIKSLHTINNPIDLLSVKEKANVYKPEIDEPYIVSVGRITPNKNLQLLLHAYKYAKDHLQLKHTLVIIGDGHDMQNIKQLIKTLDIASSVKLLGLLENPFPWVKYASLFVLSSKYEGLGMVILEALACHTKIISTASQGGIKDIMTNDLSRYLVEFSAEKLATKMVETLNENQPLSFDKYVEKFSPASIVKKYIELYTEVRGHR